MSISDLIVVMKDGVVHQIGRPQEVYDSPVNLFVAKFLGTPPINVFEGEVKDGVLYLGDDELLRVGGVSDRKVFVGIRPEGFVLDENGPLRCGLRAVEVMGRDTSVVSTHSAAVSETIRSIIPSEERPEVGGREVRFRVKPFKLFLFDRETEARVPFEAE